MVHEHAKASFGGPHRDRSILYRVGAVGFAPSRHREAYVARAVSRAFHAYGCGVLSRLSEGEVRVGDEGAVGRAVTREEYRA